MIGRKNLFRDKGRLADFHISIHWKGLVMWQLPGRGGLPLLQAVVIVNL